MIILKVLPPFCKPCKLNRRLQGDKMVPTQWISESEKNNTQRVAKKDSPRNENHVFAFRNSCKLLENVQTILWSCCRLLHVPSVESTGHFACWNLSGAFTKNDKGKAFKGFSWILFFFWWVAFVLFLFTSNLFVFYYVCLFSRSSTSILAWESNNFAFSAFKLWNNGEILEPPVHLLHQIY